MKISSFPIRFQWSTGCPQIPIASTSYVLGYRYMPPHPGQEMVLSSSLVSIASPEQVSMPPQMCQQARARHAAEVCRTQARQKPRKWATQPAQPWLRIVFIGWHIQDRNGKAKTKWQLRVLEAPGLRVGMERMRGGRQREQWKFHPLIYSSHCQCCLHLLLSCKPRPQYSSCCSFWELSNHLAIIRLHIVGVFCFWDIASCNPGLSQI